MKYEIDYKIEGHPIVNSGTGKIIKKQEILTLLNEARKTQPLEQFFFSGVTQIENGNSIAFCGLWVAETEFQSSSEIMEEILKSKRDELKKTNIVLNSFNIINR